MTTDPTITIAGLRAQVSALESAATSAADNAARLVEALYHGNGVIAAITAERDALAAQLAKVRAELAAAPKVCAIHSYALEGPCMTCGSPWPGAEKALRQERIEGMEKMRRISAAVGCPNSVEEVVEAVAAIKSDLASERAHLAACRTRIAGLERAADERSKEAARLAARVAELEARPVVTEAGLSAALDAHGHAPLARKVFAHLGPVTLPAQDRAEELTQAIHGTPREEVNPAMWRGMVERTRSALASLGAPPTSPPAARPAFAGVSASDLDVAYIGGQRECHQRHQGAIRDCCRYAAVAAVLARLEVTLVAPVDPEQIAADITGPIGDRVRTGEWKRINDAARTALTAAGVPVTPEVGK